VAFLVSNLAKLKAKNVTCNIFILKCLSLIEFNRVMIVTPKPITKIGFGLGIMP
jgi:hypothetical protein